MKACEKSWENFDSLENFIVHTTHKKFANFKEKEKDNEEIHSEIRKHKKLVFQSLTPNLNKSAVPYSMIL